MQVFKLFLKLIKNISAPLIVITVLFFLYLFIFMDTTSKDIISNDKRNSNLQDSSDKINLAVINYNQDDVLWGQLKTLLEKYCNIYDYQDEDYLIDDKMTTLNMDGIISMPYGFSKDVLNNGEVVVELQRISNNSFFVYIEDLINLYINTAQIYARQDVNSTLEQVAKAMESTFEDTKGYIQIGQNDTLINYKLYETYFKLGAYVVLTVCLLGSGMALHSFQNIHIQRRNIMSPLQDKFQNLQMFFGNFIFIILYDALIIIISLIYYTPQNLDKYIILFWINLLTFSISGLSISFLIVMLTKKREVNIIMAILLPIVLCFISGVFTSQDKLSEVLLNISYFTPVYWFVKGNTNIMNSGYGQFNILNVLPNMLIQLLFATAIFCFTLMISKEKKK